MHRSDQDRAERLAYLAGVGLGGMMRVRDLVAEGRHGRALEAAEEMVAIHLRMIVEDADEAWIAGMARAKPRAAGIDDCQPAAGSIAPQSAGPGWCTGRYSWPVASAGGRVR